mmetsp:Transcript_21333/g.31367  ORF Transcript_21333/g.31367 Transcript_21333/m.31367 type:complete len:91 (+) Transcript_21333:128-400(+)
MTGRLSSLILTYLPLATNESGNPTITILDATTITFTPLWNNIISALLTVIYVKSILGMGSFFEGTFGMCVRVAEICAHGGGMLDFILAVV